MCELPIDFDMYVRSTSIVSDTYNFKASNNTN
nr:MAG TPA: hypothetical protein [Caudoviricetes sp.]